MSYILEKAFGSSDLDLYDEVLKVPKDCTLAQLRKAYYKQALTYHPDKNPGKDSKLKFQAISWAYQLLKDPERRANYDNTGLLPHEDEDSEVGNEDKGPKAWKDYFDQIFGKLSKHDIDQFAMKYKMSEEEERDVLKHYEQFKGDLAKMLEYVMLSEERDVPRWVEDYIQPAIHAGKVESYPDALKKTLTQIEKKIKKEREMQPDTDETETEGSDDSMRNVPPVARKKRDPPRKAKPTKAKNKKSSDADLIAAIRNKSRGNPLTSLASRYGVSIGDEDPLDDDAFAKLQAKYKKKK